MIWCHNPVICVAPCIDPEMAPEILINITSPIKSSAFKPANATGCLNEGLHSQVGLLLHCITWVMQEEFVKQSSYIFIIFG